MMKQHGGACDHGRHSRQTADEKIYRNFPCPHRRLDDRLTVIAGSATGRTRRGELSWNRTSGDIDTATGDDTVLPCLLAQLFEPFFGWRIGCHEENANARSVAMIDTIPVAK